MHVGEVGQSTRRSDVHAGAWTTGEPERVRTGSRGRRRRSYPDRSPLSPEPLHSPGFDGGVQLFKSYRPAGSGSIPLSIEAGISGQVITSSGWKKGGPMRIWVRRRTGVVRAGESGQEMPGQEIPGAGEARALECRGSSPRVFYDEPHCSVLSLESFHDPLRRWPGIHNIAQRRCTVLDVA